MQTLSPGITAALALWALLLILLLILLLRRPRVQLPAEWPQRLQALETALQATQLTLARNEGALTALAQQLRDSAQHSHSLLEERLAQAAQEAHASRTEHTQALAAFRAELTHATQQLSADSQKSRDAMADGTQQIGQRVQERFDTLGQSMRATLDSLKTDLQTQWGAMASAQRDQLSALMTGQQQSADTLRATLNERLAAIQQDSADKLEAMRRTVDEKLHATLEQRLGESFRLVSERLEQVHKGLGEMQSLAASVGDLKRVMTNVKTRGTWGEMQLGTLIDDLLTAEQYGKNVKPIPGRDEIVEFAIRLPGRHEEAPIWLPIDSKYPVEHYQRLLDAQEAADKNALQAAGQAFENSIKLEAKKIYSKYVEPPHTTDFAVLYLPTEGLFAEIMRRPGLVEALQNDCRVMVTGPANFAAMLSSLQMGFRTLAIEKRSSEVWGVLGQVKTEFGKFGEIVEATRKSIDAAAKRFEQVDVRTRAIQRRLRDVEVLPEATTVAPQSSPPLLLEEVEEVQEEQ